MTDFEIITLVIAVFGLPIAAIRFFITIVTFLDKRYSRKGNEKPHPYGLAS
ncbi:MAG: hypothetical protein MJ166_11675 [Clostridia bacterium]|nr:hypothetical protein [Clostridia bacterium]